MNDPNDWSFLNKGKANAVFKYVGNDRAYKGKVIRLRLANQQVLSEEIFKFANSFRPQLDQLIDMKLVPVSISFLRALEETTGIVIKKDTHGIIMPLITLPVEKEKVSKHITLYTDPVNNYLTMEIKPKWLYSIPKDANICRNCALNSFRNEKLLCSLDLLNPDLIPGWVERLGLSQQHSKSVTHFLSQSDIFHKLYKLQHFEDIHKTISELNDENEVSEDLIRSMALKDVTVYISFADDNAEVRIIDLDQKHPSKFRHWQKQEEMLATFYSQDAISGKQCYRHFPE